LYSFYTFSGSAHQDLTEITKAQKGLEEPEEIISIRQSLEDIKGDLEKSIQEANPVIEEDLQVISITYAPRNLRSILYNLLTNAIKYRSPERTLKIRIRTFLYRAGVYCAVGGGQWSGSQRTANRQVVHHVQAHAYPCGRNRHWAVHYKTNCRK
jgi:light-regulated signal transduction histidine kinase (bacteriophytochrome)